VATKKRSRAKAGRHRGIGLLFWICLAAIIVAVAIAARPSLQAVFARLGGGAAAPTAPVAPAPQVTIAPLPQKSAPQPEASPAQPADSTASAAAPARQKPAVSAPDKSAGQPEKPATRKARLFFTTVDQDGKLLMKSVIRVIPASDSPLRDALETLLKGPTAQELNLGLLTMVPTEAKLRSVTVRGDAAYLDFNESFRFNTQGVEALDAELRQIVYAATEFPTVKSVQILIEGKKVRFMGTEGMRIDEPLSRDSFK
jgi:germination protein M